MIEIPIKPNNAKFNDDQWQAIHQSGSNILVAASAGSGKTTVLIERILTKILNQSASIDELLMVTFTEAAAKEMKDRMEARLKDSLNMTKNPDQQRQIISQLQKLPQADIRTLHSFCLKIIEDFYYLTDISADFTLITDESRLRLIKEDVWQKLISDIMSEKRELKSEAYLSLLDIYSDRRSDRKLFDMVLAIYNFERAQAESDIWLNGAGNFQANFQAFIDSPLFKESFLGSVREDLVQLDKKNQRALDLLQSGEAKTIERYLPILENEGTTYQSLLDQLIRVELNIANFIESVRGLSYERWPSIPKNSEDKELVNQVKAIRDENKQEMKKIQSLFPYEWQDQVLIDQAAARDLENLIILCRLFKEDYQAKKESLAILEYNDLEHLSLEILAPVDLIDQNRHPSVAALYYQEHFKEILVDEYQDINEIQGEILAWLSHEYQANQVGNLFMVGDVKQSIYGFRMAEPSLFLSKYLAYQDRGEPGQLIVLNNNYRSRNEVLQFTNFLFERIMGTDFGEMDYGEMEALKAGNLNFQPPWPHNDFNIRLLLNQKESSQKDISEENPEDIFDSSLEAELTLIALDIKKQVQDGRLIFDKASGKMRPVEFKDFVILSSTRGPFYGGQIIFERLDLPLKTQRVEHYFQRQEIQLILALLQIIDNPYQDIPLVAVLRSFFLGLDDEDLSQIRIHQREGSFYGALLSFASTSQTEDKLQSLQIRCRHFLEQVNHWRDLSQEVSIQDLIWQIYLDSLYLNFMAALPMGEQRVANLHALYQRADDFTQDGFQGISGFIHYIHEVIRQDKDIAEPLLLDEEDNFIQMMTVHASKGLEFPIVYLVNTSKGFNQSDSRSKYILNKDYGIASDFYNRDSRKSYKSLLKQAFSQEKSDKLKAEEMRKLYVALTRAEQALIIVGSIDSYEDWENDIENIKNRVNPHSLLADSGLRRKAKSWLNWIQIALGSKSKSSLTDQVFSIDQINIEIFHEDDLAETLKTFKEDHQSYRNYIKGIQNSIHQKNSEDDSRIKDVVDFQYPFTLASRTSSYQSVSELKRLYEDPQTKNLSHYQDRRGGVSLTSRETIAGIRYTEDTFKKPRFIEESQTVSPSELGSYIHFVLQHLEFSEFQKKNIDKELNRQLDIIPLREFEGKLTDHHFENIKWFLASDLGQLLITKGESLQREQAFSMQVPARKIFKPAYENLEVEELANDQLLIHGIIDLFLETEEGLILIDYKTNAFKPYIRKTKQEQIQSLVENYRFQFSIYARALTLAKRQPLEKVLMVLLDYQEVVEINQLYQF